MSLYQVEKVMFLMKKDEIMARQIKEKSKSSLNKFSLTPEEREALLSGDLPYLFQIGVHPLLLAPYSRIMGIARPKYIEQLAPLRGQRKLQSTQGEGL